MQNVGNGRQYNRTNLPVLPLLTNRIRCYTSAVMAADCTWQPDSVLLQTVRANNSFHRRPVYDTAAVKLATSATGITALRTQVVPHRCMASCCCYLRPTFHSLPAAMSPAAAMQQQLQAAAVASLLGAGAATDAGSREGSGSEGWQQQLGSYAGTSCCCAGI